jgi:hypothetical protein
MMMYTLTLYPCVVPASGINALSVFKLAAPEQVRTASASMPAESGHAPVNGIRMYYEVHGRRGGATPFLLLHSGSTIESTFCRVLPFLSVDHTIVAVEEQGHGRTSDRNGPSRSKRPPMTSRHC